MLSSIGVAIGKTCGGAGEANGQWGWGFGTAEGLMTQFAMQKEATLNQLAVVIALCNSADVGLAVAIAMWEPHAKRSNGSSM